MTAFRFMVFGLFNCILSFIHFREHFSWRRRRVSLCVLKTVVQSLFLTLFLTLVQPTLTRASDLEISYHPEKVIDPNPKCFLNFQKKLRNPNQLTMAVLLGYSDTIDDGYDLVTDELTMNSLIYQLTNPCQYPGQGFCEFQLTSPTGTWPRSYTRTLVTPLGGQLPVTLLIMNSSYDVSNYDNQTRFKDQQNEKTLLAQKLFAWGFKKADVLFYEGHSRDGGGPDFSPPKAASNGKVNYPWYHANRPGLKFMGEALAQSPVHPQLLGLFSCASNYHFKGFLNQKAPQTTTILSQKVISTQLTKEGLLKSLESVLNFECPSTLVERLKGTTFVINPSAKMSSAAVIY